MKVVVIGGTHPNTLSIVRSMGMQGVSVDVVLCEKREEDSYVLSSKYINKAYRVHDAEGAVVIQNKEYSRALTIICSDEVAALMNERIEYYMDKQRQVELANQVGMIVPKSMMACVGKTLVEYFPFPCLIKPLESIHGGKKVDVCNDLLELSNVLDGYDKGAKVLIQQFIKRDYEIVIDGLSLPNGNIIIPGFVRKYRDVKGGTSYAATYSASFLPEKLISQIREMVKAMGYEGLFGVEYIIANNDYYFIEMNLRNDATTYALAVAGVNLPYIYYLYKSGEDYRKEAEKEIKSINVMMEFRDLGFVLKGKVTLWQWLKDLKGCECLYYYNKFDMGPYRKARNEYVASLFGKVMKRLQ